MRCLHWYIFKIQDDVTQTEKSLFAAATARFSPLGVLKKRPIGGSINGLLSCHLEIVNAARYPPRPSRRLEPGGWKAKRRSRTRTEAQRHRAQRHRGTEAEGRYPEVKFLRFSEVPKRGLRRPQMGVLGHFLGGSRGGTHKGGAARGQRHRAQRHRGTEAQRRRAGIPR